MQDTINGMSNQEISIQKITPGTELTVATGLVNWGGIVTMTKGDRVVVEHAHYRDGHFSRLPGCKDIWIERQLKWIKLKGYCGHYSPETFKELRGQS